MHTRRAVKSKLICDHQSTTQTLNYRMINVTNGVYRHVYCTIVQLKRQILELRFLVVLHVDT